MLGLGEARECLEGEGEDRGPCGTHVGSGLGSRHLPKPLKRT